MQHPRRRFGVAVVVLCCAAATVSERGGAPGALAAGPAAATQGPAPWQDELRLWVEAVQRHQPGDLDKPLEVAASRTLAQLVAIENDLVGLRGFLGERPKTSSYRGTTFNLRALQDLLQITDEEFAHADISRLLRRAAVYHADIAMLAPRRLSTSSRVTYRELDGRESSVEAGTVHWEFGSRLLAELLKEDQLQAAFVRDWYLATAAFLQLNQMLSDADLHLERARNAVPRDAEIVFRGGCAQEVLASPRIQAVVAASVRPLDVPPLRTALHDADTLFAKAVELDPRHAEARLRHGRTAGLQGRHEEAAAELRRALASNLPEQFRYYAELFLGNEEEALKRPEAAAAAYERAAALFPTAQSPLLALAALARRAGDRAAAEAAMTRLWALPAETYERADPWPAYYFTQGGDANARLLAIYRQVSGAAR